MTVNCDTNCILYLGGTRLSPIRAFGENQLGIDADKV